jgi:hypothetical protein
MVWDLNTVVPNSCIDGDARRERDEEAAREAADPDNTNAGLLNEIRAAICLVLASHQKKHWWVQHNNVS